jgi:hypothetical protein
MRTPRRSTAIILTGAVVLASGAYAIGTQTGGGSADARDGDPEVRRFTFGPAEPFADLADALGVDEDQLRNAMEDFRRQHLSEERDAFAAALADALGKSTEEVQRALDSQRGRRPDGCPGPGLPGPDLSGLASALDVTAAELRRALRQVWRTVGTITRSARAISRGSSPTASTSRPTRWRRRSTTRFRRHPSGASATVRVRASARPAGTADPGLTLSAASPPAPGGAQAAWGRPVHAQRSGKSYGTLNRPT